jgi:hypothetical protein
MVGDYWTIVTKFDDESESKMEYMCDQDVIAAIEATVTNLFQANSITITRTNR